MKIREDLFVKYPTGLLRDLRILKLIQKFPYMGDSLYMRLNAFMMENESCEIPFESIKLLELILVSKEEDIRKVVDYCIELELYVKSADGKVFYSERLKAQREDIEAKSKMQRAKANRRWNKEIPQESNATAMPRQCHGNATAMLKRMRKIDRMRRRRRSRLKMHRRQRQQRQKNRRIIRQSFVSSAMKLLLSLDIEAVGDSIDKLWNSLIISVPAMAFR